MRELTLMALAKVCRKQQMECLKFARQCRHIDPEGRAMQVRWAMAWRWRAAQYKQRSIERMENAA